jgi:hypothetical protein
MRSSMKKMKATFDRIGSNLRQACVAADKAIAKSEEAERLEKATRAEAKSLRQQIVDLAERTKNPPPDSLYEVGRRVKRSPKRERGGAG